MIGRIWGEQFLLSLTVKSFCPTKRPQTESPSEAILPLQSSFGELLHEKSLPSVPAQTLYYFLQIIHLFSPYYNDVGVPSLCEYNWLIKKLS